MRRSQLISTYGVGSVLPIESESFMVAGIDDWRVSKQAPIEEDRLRRALGASALYSPPSSENRGMVPLVRFPEWVSCQGCGRLDTFWNLAAKLDGKHVNRCIHCTKSLVPSRFITCCAAGHIQDFPYHYWVHQGVEPFDDYSKHSLILKTDPSDSSLAGMIIVCKCGAARSLAGALGAAAAQAGCRGRSPWLRTPPADCSERVFGLQRGASNVWFPDVRSALTIDRSLTDAEIALEKVAPAIADVAPERLEEVLRALAVGHNVNPDDLISTFHKQAGSDEASAFAQLRAEEFDALNRAHPELSGFESFVCSPIEVTDAETVGGTIAAISKVPRLREVRALRGFNRVSIPSEATAAPRGRLTAGETSWLPAIEVLGEGVFVRFDNELVENWTGSKFAQSRAALVNEAMRKASDRDDLPVVTPKQLLLHSTAHALLTELSLTSGYPASSIRERLYHDSNQAGILLYTATADAAGSLGGLCSHADPERIADITRAAIERAQWCSADPVCLESTSSGSGAVNLAACHSCMLLPEVSCELQNRFLDRACLVGSTDIPDGGFFSALPFD
ncbi:MAG: DUF1998 domain-containing protein [Gordonia sp. (in: high G+C Gram-positive bacteria)]|uniref:DrmB family protein n=1 Tax=Gordonia sp. (in: high G+C Gram-positive bacteria) TaxID=84139 RepID=UPI003C741C69